MQRECQLSFFLLTKWISNNRDVLAKIPEEFRAKNVKDLNLDQDLLPVERVLGVQWCIQSDAFKFKIVLQQRPLTKRGILATMSSVYDPLGILSPVIFICKKDLARSVQEETRLGQNYSCFKCSGVDQVVRWIV